MLRYAKFFSLPVHHGLCHAPHIYSRQDVEIILGSIWQDTYRSLKVVNSPLSSATGKPLEARQSIDLIAEVLEELLTRKIHVDNIASGIIASSPGVPGREGLLWSFRSSLVLKAILAKVEADPDAPHLVCKNFTE